MKKSTALPNKNKSFTIQDVAKHLEISTKTLRRWEAKGIITPQRTAGNQRRYSLEDIRNLKSTTGTTSTKSTTSSLPRDTRGTRDTFGTPNLESVSFSPTSFKVSEPTNETLNSQLSTLNSKPKLLGSAFFIGFATLVIIITMIVGSGLNPIEAYRSALTNLGKSHLLGSRDTRGTLDTLDTLRVGVLAEITKLRTLSGEVTFNIPVNIANNLNVSGDASISGRLTTQGNIIAPNILYGITAGQNITISGDPQNPTISGQAGGVTSFQTLTGDVTLKAGSGISISGTTITSTITQATVPDTGWTDDGTVVRLTTITDKVGIGTKTPGSELEVNGVISAALGTAALPSYSFAGDLNTGLWSSTADTLNFSTGGTERLRIDSSGNLKIASLTSSSGTSLCVDGSNNIITCAAGSGAGTLQSDYDNDANGSDARIDLTTADDSLIFSNPAASGSDSTYVLEIEQLATSGTKGGFLIDHRGDSFAFRVDDESGDTTPFVIDASGNVGIGNTAPGTTLDVTGTGRFSSTLTASNGFTQTTGATNITGTSGAITLSGLSASSISTGANALTFTSSNFNTTSTGINSTNIGATTPGTGAFTTLSSTGATTLGNNSSTVAIDTTSWDVTSAGVVSGITGYTQGSGTFTVNGSGAVSLGTGTNNVSIGNTSGTFALASAGGLNVTTGGALTGVASIDTISTSATALTFAGAGALSAGGTSNLTLDAGSTGLVQIAGTSTGNIELGGGSASTGCTLTNSSGAFACTGAVTGSNISGTSSGTNTGDVTLAAIGSTPNANGASLTGQVLNLQPASADFGGVVTTGTQTLAGAKTFSGAFTLTNTFSQTGANTFSTGTGAISLNGDTTVTAGKNLSLASGTGQYTQTYTGTGNALSVTSSSTTDLNKAINISQTAATVGTDYAGYFSNTGAGTTNVGLYATATGATNNYAAIFEAGNVGIGDTSPDAFLEVLGTTEQLRLTHTDGTKDVRFTVDTSGHLTLDASTDGTGSQTLGLTGFSTLTASTLATLTTAASLDMTSTTTLSLGSNSTLSSSATALNLEENGGVDVNIAGTSGATGCTITNSNGNLACAGTVTGSNISGTSSGANTGDVTLAAIGSTPNANGATLTGQVLNLQPASADFGGVVTTGTQTLAGAKTFTGATTISNTLTVSGNNLTTLGGGLTFSGTSARTIIGPSTGGLTMTVDSGPLSLTTTTSGALTITAAAASTWSTTSGDLILASNGSSAGNIRIGATGNDSTPDLLVVGNKTLTGDPTGTTGAIYYNAADSKFRIFEGAAWKDVCNKTDAACGTGTATKWNGITAPDGDLSVAMGAFKSVFTTSTQTTGNYFALSTTGLTTGSGLVVTTSSNPAGTATSVNLFDVTNVNATTAVNPFNGLDVKFTNNPTVAANTENAMRIQNQVTANTTDNAVAALLLLDNADTSAGGSTVVTDALRITNSGAISAGITNGINFASTTIDNGINFSSAPTTSIITSPTFVVNGTGNITKINNVAYSWPASQGASNTFLKNDGAGGLTWAGTVASTAELSSITAATGTNTINSLNFAQVWNWNTLTTQTAFALGSGTTPSGITSGSLFAVGDSNTKFVHTALNDIGSLQNITFSDQSTNANSGGISAGLSISSTVNTSGAGTKEIDALRVASPTLTACATGTCTWNGLIVNTTAPTSQITVNGLNVQGATAPSSSTINGLNIGAITAGLGTENAINIGANWDNVLSVNSTPIINGSGVLQSAGLSGTYSNALTLSSTSNVFTGTIGQATALAGSFTTLSSTIGTSLATVSGNTAIGNATGTFALTSNGGLNVTTGGALTGVASIDTISTSATALTFAGAGALSAGGTSNLTLDAGSTGLVQIAGTSTGNIELGGGSASTGCTLTNSSGAFACTGAVTGSNISGTSSGTNTGDVTLAAIGSTPNANGASLTGQVLNLQPASADFGGVVTTGTQTLAGAKTFSGAFTLTNTFSQTGANTFSTGTGAISLNGDTTVTAGKNLSLASGTGQYTQTYTGTGNALSVTSSSTTDLNKAINISQTAATVGTDYAGYFSNTGAGTTNVGLYATATGATNNYAAIFEAGNVGIGDTSPAALLTVGDGDDFQVDSTGNISSTGTTGLTLTAGDIAINTTTPDITTTSTGTGSLFNANLLTLNIGGVATDVNLGVGGATAGTFDVLGGSGATGCTFLGSSGDLTCSGNITGSSNGTSGFWSRNNTTATLSPSTANDIVSIANTTTTGADLAITNTGVYTGTGIFNLTANSATIGTVANITANSLSSGRGLVLSTSATGNNFTGTLADFSITGSNSGNTTTGTVLKASVTGSLSATTALMATNAGTGTTLSLTTSGTGNLVTAANNITGTSSNVFSINNTGDTLVKSFPQFIASGTTTYAGGNDSNAFSGTTTVGVRSVFVYGKWAFVAKEGNGTICSTASDKVGCELQIYDISNPAAPIFLKGADSSSAVDDGIGSENFNSVYYDNGLVYVAKDSNDIVSSCSGESHCELLIFSWDGTSLVLKEGVDSSGIVDSGLGTKNFTSVFVDKGYVFITQESDNTSSDCDDTDGTPPLNGCELKIFKINYSPGGNLNSITYAAGSDSDGTTTAASTNAEQLNSVFVSGNYVYVAKILNGGTCGTTTAAAKLACEMQIYSWVPSSGVMTLAFASGADSDGRESSTTNGAGAVDFTSIFVTNNFAYVTQKGSAGVCSSTAGSATGCEFKVFDVSSPLKAVYAGGADSDGTTNTGSATDDLKSIFVQGNYAFVGKAGNAGVCSSSVGVGCEMQIYDVSTAASPTFRGGADSTTGAGTNTFNSVFYSNGYVYSGKAGNSGTCSSSDRTGCELQIYGPVINSTNAFQIQDASGANLFRADTANMAISLPAFSGGFNINTLTTPSKPTVTATCSGTCNTTYGYRVTALSSTGETNASSENSVSGTGTGNATTLDSTKYNTISWAAVPGAISYNIYRTTSNGTPATTGLIGKVLATQTLSFTDKGLAAGYQLPIQAVVNDMSNAIGIGLSGAAGSSGLSNIFDHLDVNGRINSRWHTYYTDFIGRSNATTTTENFWLGWRYTANNATGGSNNGTITGGIFPSGGALSMDVTNGSVASGTNASFSTLGQNAYSAGYNSVFETKVFSTSEIENAVTVIGFTNSSTPESGTADAAWFSTNGSELNCNTSEDASKTLNRRCGLMPSDSNDAIVVRIELSTAAAKFYVDGKLATTIQTNIPNGALDVQLRIQNNATNTSKGLRFNYLKTWVDDNPEIVPIRTINQSPNSLKEDISGADIAESYPTDDESIWYGDIVTINPTKSGYILKSSVVSDPGLLGVISTQPGYLLAQSTTNTNRPVALSGRVPVKISPNSPAIMPGDFITSSNEPGRGMKATHAGIMVGKALEGWTPESGKDTVLIFITTSYADPNNALGSLSFDSDGNLILPTISDPEDEVTSLGGDPEAHPTPPNPKKDLAWNLADIVRRLTKLEVENGEWRMENDKSATDSATLADLKSSILNLKSDTDTLNSKVASLEAELSTLNSQLSTLNSAPASSSAELGLSTLNSQLSIQTATISGTLSVTGRTLLADVGITGKLNAGLLTINGLDESGNASLNTISGPLKLQSDRFNGIDILNGKIVIDTSGNIKVQGELTVKKLNIEDGTDSDSVASASLGTATLRAGEASLVVQTTSITNKSKVFITPKTKTLLPLSVTQQTAGESFTVEINSPYAKDIKFNWWIIN